MEFLAQRVRATRSDAAVPRTQDGWQPLCAAYHARCRTAFEAAIRQGRLSIVELIDELHPEAITPDEMVRIGLSEAEFANVNAPEEWTRLSQLLEGEAPSVTVPINRVEGSRASRAADLLAVEEALEIQLGQTKPFDYHANAGKRFRIGGRLSLLRTDHPRPGGYPLPGASERRKPGHCDD